MRFNVLACVSGLFGFSGVIPIIIISLTLFSPLVLSENNTSSNIHIELFELTPLICVTQTLGQDCELKVKLHWRSNVNADYCFYQDNVLVTCWNKQSSGQFKLLIKLKNSTLFTLRQLGKDAILAQQKIAINYTKNENYRRRLRTQWSIF